MLKKTINYTNFNDEPIKEDFYFNLTKTELMDMNMEEHGSMDEMLQRVIDTKDKKTIYNVFKNIVLMSYGVKSADGKRFMKKDPVDGHRLADDFAETNAFDVLMFDLLSDDKKASDFVNGIMPKDLPKKS